MKKLIKFFLYTFAVLIVLSIILFAVYAIWVKSVSIPPERFVARDFLVYAHINDPVDTIERINKSQLLETFRAESGFSSVYNYFEKIRAVLYSRSKLLKTLASVSTHAVYFQDDSFVIMFDLGLRTLAARLGFTAFKTFIADKNHFAFKSETYKEYTIQYVKELESGMMFYFLHHKNLFIVSQKLERIKSAVDTYTGTRGLETNPAYTTLRKKAYSGNLINLYANTSLLVNSFLSGSPHLKRVFQLIQPNLMSFHFMDATREGMTISAYQNNQINNAFVKKFFASSARKSKADAVLPLSTSHYTCMTFNEFKEVWDFLKTIFKNNPEVSGYFDTAERKIKDFTGMTLEKWLFSWINHEIGVGMLEDNEDPFIIIQCKNTAQAIKNIEHLTVSLISTRPDTFQYKGHKVNQIALPPGMLGLARLFVPNLRLPFYTVIEDLLIISQSRRVISEIIDGYKTEKVLRYDDVYKKILSQVDYEGNVIAYWDMNKRNFGLLNQNTPISRLLRKYNRGVVTVNFEEGLISQRVYVEGRENRIVQNISPFPLEIRGKLSGSPIFYDIDDDNVKEIIFSEENGNIHVLSSTGIPKYNWKGVKTKARLYGGVKPFKYRDNVYFAAVDAEGNIHVWNHKGELVEEFLNKKIEGQVNAPIEVGDINNDGIPDIIIATVQGNVYAMDMNANMLEGFPVKLDKGVFLAPVIADFTGNDKNEIIIATRSFTGEIYVIDGSGKILSDYTKKTGFLVSAPLMITDLNGDGKPEVIAFTRNGKVFVFNKDGDLPGFPFDTGSVIRNAGLVYQDEDGKHIACLLSNGKIITIKSNGTAGKVITGNGNPSPNTPLVYAKIMDKQVFVFGGSDKRLYFITTDGKPVVYPSVFGSESVAVLDMDNDGYPEVLSGGYDRRVYLYRLFR